MSLVPVESSNARLGIPRSIASRYFMEVALNVLESPGLRRIIRTYIVPGLRMDLAREAASADFAVSIDHCPALRLWPEPRDGQPLTNISQSMALNINATIYVASVDPLDALDIYGLIEDAVHPNTVAAGAALSHRLGQIGHWQGIRLIQPAAVMERAADGSGLIAVAEGAVAVDYRHRGF